MNVTKGKLVLLMSIPFAIVLAWGIFTTLRLSSTRATMQQNLVVLTQTQNELASTKQQLTDVQTELVTAQDNLTQTQSTLTQTQTQLNTAKTELSNTKNQLLTTQSQLSTANSALSSTQSQLSDAQSQLTSSQQQLADYTKTMQALGISVHSSTTWNFNGQQWTHTDNSQATNPTWNQLTTFITQDKTDQHPYNVQSFNCVNYATTVYNNAETSSIESAMVTIKLRNSTAGHAVDAFITSDYGLVYVDCTGYDAIARVEVGKVYRAVSPGTVQPGQVRNDSWWDALRGNYYYLSNDLGGQAVVDSIDIYW